jgi:hypothetical protein
MLFLNMVCLTVALASRFPPGGYNSGGMRHRTVGDVDGTAIIAVDSEDITSVTSPDQGEAGGDPSS